MADNIILLDTSILIDYFRKTDKSKSIFTNLASSFNFFSISVVTEFEILAGMNPAQSSFWKAMLDSLTILPLTSTEAKVAAEINQKLKSIRKQIAIADLFIAASAIANNLPLATLNKNHFERILELKIVN